MKSKEFFGNVLKSVGILFLCGVVNLAVMMLNSNLGTAEESSSDTILLIKSYIGIVLFIVVPFVLGRLLLKDTAKVSLNIFSVLLPGVIASVIMSALIFYYSSDDTTGFFIVFINAPGLYLSAYINQLLLSDTLERLQDPIFYLCIGLTPLSESFLIYIGLLWKSMRRKHRRPAV